MKNKRESQEADKYGKITPGEATKLLIDIIGQNVIINFMSKDHPNSKSYERKLQRIFKGNIPYHNIASLQRYYEQFSKEIEDKYEISPLGVCRT